MKDVLVWMSNNQIFTYTAIVITIALLVYLYINKRDLLCKAALHAVAAAEDAWGSNMGRIKFAEVYTYLKKEYPIVTIFFTEKQLSDIIEKALDELKKILASKSKKEEVNNEEVKSE